MQTDEQWDDLTRQWQQQPVAQQPDIGLIKRRVLMHRLRISGLILFDILITVITAYFLLYGINHDFSASMHVWLGFGLVFGVLVTVAGLMIRIKAWRQPAMNTQSWLDFEIRRARSQYSYANLTMVSTLVFLAFFHLWLLAGMFFDPEFELTLNTRGIMIYSFALLWTALFCLVAHKLKKRAAANIARYTSEQALFE